MSVRVIAGQVKGRSLKPSPRSSIRPTSDLVRGALFSILGPAVVDASVLDLFAGTGALGIEALSRGAARADFVESHPRQCAALRASLHALDMADRCQVRCSRVERALASLTGPYDLLFLDPPYAYANLGQLLERIAHSSLVAERSIVAVEHTRRLELAEVYGPLTLARRRSYGDTAISLYHQGETPW